MLAKIKEIIQQVLPGATIYVLDPRNDGHHLEAIVISDEFIGLSLIKQHKIVMNSLKEEFKSSVHALGLKTYTQASWEKEQNK
jgi:acid stress-induced BolA-like protein IbaG/YrbA